MKQEINVYKSTQTAIKEMGKEEKTIYYLVIGEGDNKVTINVGKKTYETITELNKKK